ncbi:MAG TPA: hypothetical protein VE988_05880 [Gemmataceae bacterium]|nr:hypothetical protein [Gemmataceae bacterium]
MKINGIEGLSLDEIDAELAAGGRFVYYEYCISLLLITFRRPTNIYFLRADDKGMLKGLPFVVLSLVLGWWGIPWGFVYTPMAIFSNLGGGRDVTNDVRRSLKELQETERLANELQGISSEAIAEHGSERIRRSEP